MSRTKHAGRTRVGFCGENFHSNKSLRIVRMMLLGRKGCRKMSKIRIPNPCPNPEPRALHNSCCVILNRMPHIFYVIWYDMLFTSCVISHRKIRYA